MKNLLVPVDFSDVTDRVVASAEQMARAFGAKVWLMHCVGEYPAFAAMGEIPAFLPTPETALPETYPDQYRKLAELTSGLRGRGVDVESLFVGGMAVEQIQSVADQHQIDLIIMGSHGHGAWYELLVGTVTEGVLHRIGRPVLVVPSDTRRDKKASDLKPATKWEQPAVTPY